jgi:transcriptional regulator GlxA family with amidase domain
MNRHIAIVTVPGVQLLDVAGPMDVFNEANRFIGAENAYVIHTVGLDSQSIIAGNGLSFSPSCSIENSTGAFDTILVAGSPGMSEVENHRGLIQWLIDQSHRVRRMSSVCTGAFLFAHAGLLTGKRATTHWNSVGRLAEMFPKINVEPDRIYVQDGEVYTSAGVTASMDLALALVEDDHGRGVALRVAKELVLFLKRPGGQSQFSMQLAAQVSDRGPVKDVHEWIMGNLAGDLSVQALATHVGMSIRNFSRIFKRETNQTPAVYVESARVDAARRMLEGSDAPLKKIASTCGFTDHWMLRRAFLRCINSTPREYRRRFRRTDSVGQQGSREAGTFVHAAQSDRRS